MTQLTPEELAQREQDKVLTLARYQERLDKVCDENDSKMAHWDEKAKLKAESEKRMWEEGKLMIREHRKRAQREIDHLIGVSAEQWPNVRDRFEAVYTDVVSAYHKATSKIR